MMGTHGFFLGENSSRGWLLQNCICIHIDRLKYFVIALMYFPFSLQFVQTELASKVDPRYIGLMEGFMSMEMVVKGMYVVVLSLKTVAAIINKDDFLNSLQRLEN